MNYSKVVPLHQTSEAENGGAGQSPSFHEIMEAHPPPHVVCGDMDEVSSVASKSRFKAAGLAQVMSMDRNLHRAELQYYPGTPNSETMQSTAAQQLLVPSLREAFTVGQGGKGSALLPLLHCCAEQCCLYNRETRSWCCGGPLAYLHDGKRWKWESFLAPCFLLFIILEAVLAWQVLISSSDDSFGKWIRRPQNSWGIAAMIYINIAVGAFLPVGHAYLKPADYSKCSSEDAFEGDRKTITNVFKRRIFEYYPGIRDRSDRNSDAAGPTPEDVKIHSEQHADHCIAVRKKLEGALATWKKWVKQYRFFNNYAIVFQVISSIAIPLLSQLITCEGSSQLLLTLVSTHAAIVLGLEKAMRSQEKYRAYRGAESSALDYWRRLVHMPWTLRDGMSSEGLDFLDIIKEELTIFMRQSEEVRDFARKIETYAGNREAEGSKDNSNQQSRGRVPAEHDAVSSMGAGASSISRPPTSAEQPRPAPP